MYDSILPPTDGSQEMAAVIEEATGLAELCEATIHALDVDERASLSVPDDSREHVRETLAEDGRAATTAIPERAAGTDIEVVAELRWGDPTAEIVAFAVEADVDLLVMGTHGRTGYERYLLGSVAEKVVRVVPMPVLAIAVGGARQRGEAIRAAVDRAGSATEATDGDGTPQQFGA